MNFHYRPLNTYEVIIQGMLACATSDKRLHCIEMSHQEHKEFVAIANTQLGIHELESLQRGFFKGVALKVITDVPNIVEVKDAILEAATPPPIKSEKLTKVLKTLQERGVKKGTK